jgi:ribosomal protein S18 acetylase RimI-like enzyme
MVEIIAYANEDHRERFFELNLEYIRWVADKYKTIHDIDLESVNGKSNEEYVKEFLQDFTELEPPRGQILLLRSNNEIVGMGAIAEHEPGIGEIKRMYVKPNFRGHGYGRKLFSRLIEKGKDFRFSKILLETADFFEAARNLYRSIGFRDIEEYSGGEVSLCLRETTKYMELDL